MAGPTIVFIHGMWSRPAIFAQLRAELEAAGLRTAAVPLRGHDLKPGAPPPAALGALGLADYLRDLRTAVAAIDGPLILAGHSLGGLLAQQLAAEIRPAGLILLATAPSRQAGALGAAFSLAGATSLRGMLGRWGWWRRAIRPSEAAARYGIFNLVPEAELQPLLADLGWDSGRVLAELLWPWLFAGAASEVAYHRLQLPALVIAGAEDHLVPLRVARRTARLLAAAGARIDHEEWPDAGHWLFHDSLRPRLAGAIARFAAAV